MRKLSHWLLIGTELLMGAAVVTGAAAQGPDSHPGDNGGLNGSLSHSDLERLSGQRKSGDPNDTPSAHAKAKVDVQPLIETAKLSCELADARLVVSGKRTLNGHSVDTKVYEVGCRTQLGYLIETAAADLPLTFSCIAAEEARAADVARGKEPSFFCRLPQNVDVYATVSNLILSSGGSRCEVKELKHFGHSQQRQSDYSEVACKDGGGYLLEIPKPGTETKMAATSCADAAAGGIRCRMTDVGAP
jgi:hypothetical protein